MPAKARAKKKSAVVPEKHVAEESAPTVVEVSGGWEVDGRFISRAEVASIIEDMQQRAFEDCIVELCDEVDPKPSRRRSDAIRHRDAE